MSTSTTDGTISLRKGILMTDGEVCQRCHKPMWMATYVNRVRFCMRCAEIVHRDQDKEQICTDRWFVSGVVFWAIFSVGLTVFAWVI